MQDCLAIFGLYLRRLCGTSGVKHLRLTILARRMVIEIALRSNQALHSRALKYEGAYIGLIGLLALVPSYGTYE